MGQGIGRASLYGVGLDRGPVLSKVVYDPIGSWEGGGQSSFGRCWPKKAQIKEGVVVDKITKEGQPILLLRDLLFLSSIVRVALKSPASSQGSTLYSIMDERSLQRCSRRVEFGQP